MKPPSRIVSAVGRTRKGNRDRAGDNERLVEFVDDVKRQIEPQLRKAGHRRPAEEAETIAAADYGYDSLVSFRRKKARVRAAKKRKRKSW
jgi:hypothetical protein